MLAQMRRVEGPRYSGAFDTQGPVCSSQMSRKSCIARAAIAMTLALTVGGAAKAATGEGSRAAAGGARRNGPSPGYSPDDLQGPHWARRTVHFRRRAVRDRPPRAYSHYPLGQGVEGATRPFVSDYEFPPSR